MKDKIYLHTIKSAEKLFNRFGFSKTAMTDIARAADVSRATIFNNFGNKEGLLQAVLDNKQQEMKLAIQKRMNKAHSVSGQLKAVVVERVKMLAGMKFISEHTIALENKAVDKFMEDINQFFIKKASGILWDRSRKSDEINSLVNTIFFMLKGMEQAVSEQIGSFSIVQVERDIDYFLKIVLPDDRAGSDLQV